MVKQPRGSSTQLYHSIPAETGEGAVTKTRPNSTEESSPCKTVAGSEQAMGINDLFVWSPAVQCIDCFRLKVRGQGFLNAYFME